MDDDGTDVDDELVEEAAATMAGPGEGEKKSVILAVTCLFILV